MPEQTANNILERFDRLHDLVFRGERMDMVKRLVIRLSVAGFAAHIALIFLANALPHPPALIAEAGRNYLNAISTPFNFILFYEVLTLIGALHVSTTRSIGYQFEIVSLIFIRETFHDIAHSGSQLIAHPLAHESWPLLLDMWAGFAMYLLVAVYQHVGQYQLPPSLRAEEFTARRRFIMEKKAVALALAALLVAMAAYNLVIFFGSAWHGVQSGNFDIEAPTTFYNDLFTVMIFTDVLMLILSLVVTGRYENVFRNAAFVVSIILIRFSLTAGYPVGAPLALMAMIFGILTLVVYHYHRRVGVSLED